MSHFSPSPAGELRHKRKSGAGASPSPRTDGIIDFTSAGTAEVKYPPFIAQICISERQMAMSHPTLGPNKAGIASHFRIEPTLHLPVTVYRAVSGLTVSCSSL